jgi:hypothetical protein
MMITVSLLSKTSTTKTSDHQPSFLIQLAGRSKRAKYQGRFIQSRRTIVLQSGSSGVASFNTSSGSVRFKSNQSSPSTLPEKLKSFGLAGLLSYGIFNTLYYVGAFLIVWSYAKVPSGLGFSVALQRIVALLATIWVGSQVTKLPRAAAALLFAPATDWLLNTLQKTLKLKTKKAAFALVVTVCIAGALLLFGSIIVAIAV